MKNKSVMILGIATGVIFFILSVVYLVTPARSLPPFLPGYDGLVSKVHYKHALASLVLSLGLFAFVWFHSGPKSGLKKK